MNPKQNKTSQKVLKEISCFKIKKMTSFTYSVYVHAEERNLERLYPLAKNTHNEMKT